VLTLLTNQRMKCLECERLLCGQLATFLDLIAYLVGTHILVLHVPRVILTQNLVDFLIVESGVLLVIIDFYLEITNLE